jgi:hypothetical protein
MAKHSPPRWIDPTGDDFDVYYTYQEIHDIAAASQIAPEKCDELGRRLSAAAYWYACCAQEAAKNAENSRADEVRRKYVTELLAGIFMELAQRPATANPSERKGARPVDGPFVRFVQGAMKPLGQQISGNAIRDMRRGKKPSRRKNRRRGNS